MTAAAGLSLGEYCALVFAEVLTFEEGLRIVKVRAESMAAAATSGLASVSMHSQLLLHCCDHSGFAAVLLCRPEAQGC